MYSVAVHRGEVARGLGASGDNRSGGETAERGGERHVLRRDTGAEGEGAPAPRERGGGSWAREWGWGEGAVKGGRGLSSPARGGDQPQAGGGGSPRSAPFGALPLHHAASRRGPPPRAGRIGYGPVIVRRQQEQPVSGIDEANVARWRAAIGREEMQEQRLDRGADALRAGGRRGGRAMPPLAHWAFFLPSPADANWGRTAIRGAAAFCPTSRCRGGCSRART
ncbi:hypothetical protein AB5I41_17685 [Sphingomonas sp. MMS24-JH45]